MTEANKFKLLGEVCFLMARILPGSPVLLLGGNSLLRRPPRKHGPGQDKVRQHGSGTESGARTVYSVRCVREALKKEIGIFRNNS